MRESACPPRRMRYSLESRARIVSLIIAGESPQAAAAVCGAHSAATHRSARVSHLCCQFSWRAGALHRAVSPQGGDNGDQRSGCSRGPS